MVVEDEKWNGWFVKTDGQKVVVLKLKAALLTEEIDLFNLNELFGTKKTKEE